MGFHGTHARKLHSELMDLVNDRNAAGKFSEVVRSLLERRYVR